MTMDSNDAIETAHAFKSAAIVAAHNHGWAHFKESQADLAAAFAALGLADGLTNLETRQADPARILMGQGGAPLRRGGRRPLGDRPQHQARRACAWRVAIRQLHQRIEPG
jgi:hypothetical protein